MFLDFKNPISLFEMVGVPDRLGFVFIFGLDDHVLDSSEFDDVSGF